MAGEKNIYSEGGVRKELNERVEKVVQRLKAEGWIEAPDNPYNEMVYDKKCFVCGSKITHRLTKTAFLTEKQIEKIIESAKSPEKCINCLELEKKDKKDKDKKG